ncbi:hypothetical protein EVG20_g11327 [Dentipellis fragilis]|uniref:Uncharacterized protein n=1 Tax=Dentipellis fragilis TaxID=205917 RepID=A0A4Y9XL79_9AGAM|nr:hypothetical protein EVG20_g11327 [Dentipellis fragilis]
MTSRKQPSAYSGSFPVLAALVVVVRKLTFTLPNHAFTLGSRLHAQLAHVRWTPCQCAHGVSLGLHGAAKDPTAPVERQVSNRLPVIARRQTRQLGSTMAHPHAGHCRAGQYSVVSYTELGGTEYEDVRYGQGTRVKQKDWEQESKEKNGTDITQARLNLIPSDELGATTSDVTTPLSLD